MPDLADLGRAVDLMRRGHGRRRVELRRLLATIDPRLRHARNLERLRLAGLKARLRMLDTRADPAALQTEAEASAGRLEALDREIVRAIAAQLRPRSP